MNKLLHDRLREWAEKSKEEDRFPATIALRETYEYDFYDSKEQERKLYAELADEIERYYIPRHTDSEGNPWLIGDKAIDGEGEEFIVQGYGYEDDYPYLINVYSGTIHDGQWCTRPSPKVYSANGVEIKEGDTMYYTDNLPTERYVGDRVVVKRITDGLVDVYNTIHKHEQYEINGDYLTHKKPDSLEKLYQDMMEHHENWDSDPNEWLEMATRLSALIERVD